MEIIFKGRQTDVAARFRDQAAAKLAKLGKLDQKAIRVELEVSVERNPRQASQKERVELTIVSRGPVIRAEAAAEDRFAALDMAMAKLDSRLRRMLDRRKSHHAAHGPERAGAAGPALPSVPAGAVPAQQPSPQPGASGQESLVPIEMDGDGPVVVRQKFHQAEPISIDQALLEMELVGHDFYLFHDIEQDMPSVVYRRRGYQYGVIRLVRTRQRAAGARTTAAPSEASASAQAGTGAAGQEPKESVSRSG